MLECMPANNATAFQIYYFLKEVDTDESKMQTRSCSNSWCSATAHKVKTTDVGLKQPGEFWMHLIIIYAVK